MHKIMREKDTSVNVDIFDTNMKIMREKDTSVKVDIFDTNMKIMRQKGRSVTVDIPPQPVVFHWVEH